MMKETAVETSIHRILRWCAKRLKSHQESWLVFCARMRCLSLVDTEPVTEGAARGLVVRHCLLWPTLKDCDQRCFK